MEISSALRFAPSTVGARCPHDAARGLRREPEAAQAGRGGVRLGQDHRRHGQGESTRAQVRSPRLHVRDGCLQSDPDAEAARGSGLRKAPRRSPSRQPHPENAPSLRHPAIEFVPTECQVQQPARVQLTSGQSGAPLSAEDLFHCLALGEFVDEFIEVADLSHHWLLNLLDADAAYDAGNQRA